MSPRPPPCGTTLPVGECNSGSLGKLWSTPPASGEQPVGANDTSTRSPKSANVPALSKVPKSIVFTLEGETPPPNIPLTLFDNVPEANLVWLKSP